MLPLNLTVLSGQGIICAPAHGGLFSVEFAILPRCFGCQQEFNYAPLT